MGLALLSGCNQRRGAIEKYSMDGVYELVYFIDSNLNSNNTVFDPFEHYDRYAIEIHGTTLKTIIRSKNSQNNVIVEYQIDQVTDFSFKIRIGNSLMNDLFYFNIYESVIELKTVGSSKLHYIFSKYDFDTLKIPDGTYELTIASGYHQGQMISTNLYEYFDFHIDGNKISYESKHSDGTKYWGSGTYIAGISGIVTQLANTNEYLHYDPVNQTLTFETKYFYLDSSQNSNYILVFEILN
jgi:hypothetical protein